MPDAQHEVIAPVVPESEIKHEVHKTGHRMLDLAIAGVALFVSLCSLGLAIHQGLAMDRLVRANSEPVLKFANGNAHPLQSGALEIQRALYYSVENPGAGVARIEWSRIEVYGHTVHDWREGLQLARARALTDDPALTSVEVTNVRTSDLSPIYLKPSSELVVFIWPRTEQNAPLWDILDRVRSRAFHLTACYCSIFDQCWIADSKADWPKQVDSCAASMPKDARPSADQSG